MLSKTLCLTRNSWYRYLFTHTRPSAISLAAELLCSKTCQLALAVELRAQPSGVHTAERFYSIPSATAEEGVSAGYPYIPCAKLLSSPSVVGNLEEKRYVQTETLQNIR